MFGATLSGRRRQSAAHPRRSYASQRSSTPRNSFSAQKQHGGIYASCYGRDCGIARVLRNSGRRDHGSIGAARGRWKVAVDCFYGESKVGRGLVMRGGVFCGGLSVTASTWDSWVETVASRGPWPLRLSRAAEDRRWRRASPSPRDAPTSPSPKTHSPCTP